MASCGVLFDVDGTLVDTTYLHAVCWSQTLREAGHDMPMARAHRAIGMGSHELLEHLVPERDRSLDAHLKDRHLALYKGFWGGLRPLPGAASLLRECKSRGLRVALASSASEEELATLCAALDADDAFDVATSSSDADAGKPSPDILTAALSQAGLTAGGAVLVGDSVWDAAAAGRAGLDFVAVTCGGVSAAELRDAGAVEVWRDPADLLEHLDASRLGALASRS